MKKILKIVALVLFASRADASVDNRGCEQLWRMLPTLQEKDHPVIDSFGEVISGIALKELVFSNGDPFIPGSDLESNCYLDRALDARSKSAIKLGAVVAMRQRDLSPKETLQLIEEAISSDLRTGHSEGGDILDLRIEVQRLYKIQGVVTGDPGRFQLFSNTRGFYHPKRITDFVFLSYIRHLGIWNTKFEQILDYLVKQDREFHAPDTFTVAGCDDPLEYRWGIDGALVEDSYNGLSSNNIVHFGLCRKKQTVWSYHYTLGWWELKGKALKDFCLRAPMKLGLFDVACNLK